MEASLGLEVWPFRPLLVSVDLLTSGPGTSPPSALLQDTQRPAARQLRSAQQIWADFDIIPI